VSYRPVAIRFEIVEGPQTIVSGVTFDGNTTIASTALQEQMALQGGKPFLPAQLSVDRDAIERAYRNQGFQNVSVISQLTVRQRAAAGRAGLDDS
jgi:outer membrane protein assembly factor BamA